MVNWFKRKPKVKNISEPVFTLLKELKVTGSWSIANERYSVHCKYANLVHNNKEIQLPIYYSHGSTPRVTHIDWMTNDERKEINLYLVDLMIDIEVRKLKKQRANFAERLGC